jgi:hypothetical protein
LLLENTRNVNIKLLKSAVSINLLLISLFIALLYLLKWEKNNLKKNIFKYRGIKK